MEKFGGENNLSIEKQETQEKIVKLLEIIDSLKLDSNTREDFIEYLDENGLNYKDYFISNLFIARLSGKVLPEESEYKFFDTKDGKIELFINNLAENLEKKAA